ncbi:hypothetical protein Dimus_030457 [Dionaea muscipula]
MGEVVDLDGEGTWAETAKTSTTGHGFDGEPVFVRIERTKTGNRLISFIPFDFVYAIKDFGLFVTDLGFLIWVMARWEVHYTILGLDKSVVNLFDPSHVDSYDIDLFSILLTIGLACLSFIRLDFSHEATADPASFRDTIHLAAMPDSYDLNRGLLLVVQGIQVRNRVYRSLLTGHPLRGITLCDCQKYEIDRFFLLRRRKPILPYSS